MPASPESALVVRMEATLARFERQLDQGRRKAKDTSRAIEKDLSSIGTRGFSGQSQMQAFGQSFSQMMQSVSAGTQPVNAFSMQLADMTMMMGPLGMAIGAIGGVALPILWNAFGNATEDADALQDSLDELESATKDYIDATKAAGVSTDELTAKYGSRAAAARDALNAEKELAAEEQRAANREAAQSMNRTVLGDFSQNSPEDFREIIRLTNELARERAAADDAAAAGGGFDFDRQARIQNLREQIQAYGDLDDRIAALQETMGGATQPAAERLAIALGNLGRAVTVDEEIAAWTELQDAFNDAIPPGKILGDQGRALATEIGRGLESALELGALDVSSNLAEGATESAKIAGNLEEAVRQAESLAALRLLPGGEALASERAARYGYQGARAEGAAIEAASEREAADQGIVALIRYMEGTAGAGGYNTTLGGGHLRPEGSDAAAKPLTEMTLAEIFRLQKQMLANPLNRATYGEPSSALGLPQIVGSTLFGESFSGRRGAVGVAERLGLSMEDRFSVDVQNRILEELVRMRVAQGTAQGDLVGNFRDEWEGLQKTSAENILHAISVSTTTPVTGGAPPLATADPTTIRETDQFIGNMGTAITRGETERAREAERVVTNAQQAILAAQQARAREEEALAREAERLDEQEAARLADLAQDRLDANLAMQDSAAQLVRDQEFEASLIGRTAEEVVALRTAYELLNQAREAGVDLADRVGQSEQTIGELIQETAIAAGRGAAAMADLNEAQGHVEDRNAFIAAQWQDLKNGILDAIVAGESFTDTLGNIAQALGRATLEAALFGTGPLSGAGDGSGGLTSLLGLGDLFAPKTYEGGGNTWSGPRTGGVDGRGGRYAILHPNESVYDHVTGTGGSGGETAIRVYVDDDAKLHAVVERTASRSTQAGIAAYDSRMPSRVKGIQRDPRRR